MAPYSITKEWRIDKTVEIDKEWMVEWKKNSGDFDHTLFWIHSHL